MAVWFCVSSCRAQDNKLTLAPQIIWTVLFALSLVGTRTAGPIVIAVLI